MNSGRGSMHALHSGSQWRPSVLPSSLHKRRAAARSSQANVFESITLLEFSADTTAEDVAQLVDGIWSLQFTAAGPICSTAGQVLQLGPAAAAAAAAPASHAVLFRYASQAAAERFQTQPRVQLMLGGTGAPEGTGLTTINFQGAVPNDLESIFRRGGDWETGVELVLALAHRQQQQEEQEQQGEGTASAGEEFLALTQQLALSSAFGAVQCSYGRCLAVPRRHGGAAQQQEAQQGVQQQQQQQQPDIVMLVRFQEGEALQRFLDCPPVAALLEGDERLPLRTLWGCALVAAPSDSSGTSPVGGSPGML